MQTYQSAAATNHRRQYFKTILESNEREIERLRAEMEPRIKFLNANKGRTNQDLIDARERVQSCRRRIDELKEKNRRILANGRI